MPKADPPLAGKTQMKNKKFYKFKVECFLDFIFNFLVLAKRLWVKKLIQEF